jgi:hypothetical protein
MSSSPDHSNVHRVFLFLQREHAYLMANVALLVFNGALMGFAFAPQLIPDATTALAFAEVALGAAAVASSLGIILHIFGSRSWLSRWCYLLTCFGTALTGSAFLVGGSISSASLLSFSGRIVIIALLCSGGLIAFFMHIEYGARARQEVDDL